MNEFTILCEELYNSNIILKCISYISGILEYFTMCNHLVNEYGLFRHKIFSRNANIFSHPAVPKPYSASPIPRSHTM